MAMLSMSHETLTLWSGLVLRLGTPDGLNKLGFGQAVFLPRGNPNTVMFLRVLNSIVEQFCLDCSPCCKVKHLHRRSSKWQTHQAVLGCL